MLPRQIKLLYKILSTSAIKVPLINKYYNQIHWKRYNNDFSKEVEKFNKFSKTLNNYQFDYKNKTILEIGTGNQIGTGLCFLMDGAGKYIFQDKFQCFFNTKAEADFVKNMAAHIEKEFNRKFPQDFIVVNDCQMIFDKKISFITCPAEKLDLPDNSVDIIVSNFVLEHLRDLESSFREFNRVLKKQGVILHNVDLKNHKDFSNPYDIMRYSDYFWENFLCAPETYQNRFRSSDYGRLLKKNNFESILFEGSNPSPAKFNRKIHKLNSRFEKLTDEDLNILELYFFAVKKS